jgi:hypothetical protein
VQFGASTLTIVNLPLANIMFQAYDLEPRQFSFGDFTQRSVSVTTSSRSPRARSRGPKCS